MSSASGLENISYCRFLTKIDRTWSQDQWRARDIVQAVKGKSFDGYVYLTVRGANRLLDKDNPEVAFEWFVEQVQTTTHFSSKLKHYICPIPDSKCTVLSGRPSKTMRLANALVGVLPQLGIWDSLRFYQEMPKSSEVNMRDEEALFQALRTLSKPPKGRIILLDDVCTTGAHARAAARELTRVGATNIVSMSVARTMLNPEETVFGRRIDVL